MGLLTATADRLANLFGYVRAKPEELVQWETRANLYKGNELLYSGQVYNTRARGGALEDVLREAIGPAYCNPNRYPILPAFLPFRAIVDLYQNTLPGRWGHEVRIANEYDGRPVNPRLAGPLGRLWRASNLDTQKALLFRYAANFGTVGIRVSTTGGDRADGRPVRVSVAADHPGRLFNFEEDADGNVTAVCLKYQRRVNAGTLADPDWQQVDVVEEITRDDFSVRHDGVEQLADAARRNAMGFCPYVILRHKPNSDSPFGDWAYKGAEGPVHRINWRISRQDKSVDRHQFPRWFGAAGGKAPTSDVEMGDDKMTYVQTSPDTPPPILQAIVPQIDQEESRAFWQDLRDLLRTQQPEMNLNDVKLLGNVSGEALAQVLKPTEQAILAVRPGYQHALVRALQMGLSAGVVAGAWDLGTGTGTSEAGDRAFRDGLEDFEFAETPALPETPQQRVTNAAADVADRKAKLELANLAKTVSERERLRLAGYTQADIEQIEAEKAEQDVLDEDDPDDEEEDDDA